MFIIVNEDYTDISMVMGKESNTNKKQNNRSLENRTRIVLAFSMLIFGTAFLISILAISARNRWDYGITESETVINAMASSIQANIQNYKDISRLIMLDGEVRTFLNTEEPDNGLINDARFSVMNILIASDNVDSVFVFRNDHKYMSTGRGEYIVDHNRMKDVFWQEEILVQRGGAVVFMNANNAVYRSNRTPLITIGRAIYDIDSQKRVGILLVNISVEMLESELMEIETSDVCVVTENGLYLAGNDELAVCYSSSFVDESIVHKKMKYGKGKEIVSGYKLADLPLVVMCANNEKTTKVPVEITFLMFLIMVAYIISFSQAALFIAREIGKPILSLSEAMEKTKKTGYLEKIEVEMPNNEIGMLADSYNGMIEHLNGLFTEVIEKEKSIQRAEMRVLHEQIKPHFLYNSLESISYLALDAKAENVHTALETLGSFYRNFLSKGDREIPLKREINIIKDYLSLQKLRYVDVINDEYEIADDTLEVMIPKLILQPLVENSIYHGIRLTGEPGTIRIASFLKEDELHIIVKDTGVGMPPDLIDSILRVDDKKEKNDDTGSLSGFGLKGTIERIRYYCNSDDVVSIRSEEGEYTEIEITLPVKEMGRQI